MLLVRSLLGGVKVNQIRDWFSCNLSVQQFESAHAQHARLCLGFVLDKLQGFPCLVWRTRRRLASALCPKKAPEGGSGSVRWRGTCRAAMQSRREACRDKVAIAT